MKKLLVSFVSLVVVVWISGLTGLAAEGRGVAQGHATSVGRAKTAQAKKAEHKQAKASEQGKPEEKGLEHADQVASPQGAEHGISKAQAKQSAHRESAVAAPKAPKGKHTAKGKQK